jgi:D-alanyl-D-alanine dipeptidase
LDRPIPISNSPPTTAEMGAIAFDAANPMAQEALVNLVDAGIDGENYYGRTDGQNPPYNQPIEGALRHLYARETVALMLQNVTRQLAKYNLRPFVLDAYRPITTQLGLWKFFRKQIAERLLREGIEDKDAIDAETRKYVSDPRKFNLNDSRTWPLHSTGGAIDLTLFDVRRGTYLDLGSHFDEMAEASFTDYLSGCWWRGKSEVTIPAC